MVDEESWSCYPYQSPSRPMGKCPSVYTVRDASNFDTSSEKNQQTTNKMLAIRKSRAENQNCTPNLLPCKINHDGPVNASERYWKPEAGEGTTGSPISSSTTSLIIADGSQTAYFRGRKLEGKAIKVPEGYRGWSKISSKDHRVTHLRGCIEDYRQCSSKPNISG